jgi:hypothetical protein
LSEYWIRQQFKTGKKKFGRDLKIDLIPDIHLLNEDHADEIRLWINQCFSENDNGPLDIQFHYDVGMPFNNIETIFTALAQRGITCHHDSLVNRWADESI